MNSLFTRNERIVEKGLREKSFFSTRDDVTLLDKFFMGVLSVLVILFGLNIYQTIANASVLEILF